MCGRARCSLSHEEVRAAAKIERWVEEERYFPSYNSSPGHSTPVIKHSKEGEQEIHTMKWGLIPSYTKAEDKLDFFRMFNARSETVAEKGVFKRLLNQQRCVVLLNGFYEWKKEGKEKQPYYIHQEGHEVMRMAGLFDCWHGPEGELYSYTILTTDSSKKLQWLHDRMPVILHNQAAEQAWLSQDGGNLGKLCMPYNGEDLAWFAVDRYMSNSRNDGPQCCRPLKRNSVASFFKPKAQGGADVKAEASAKVKSGASPSQTADLKAEDGAAVAEADLAGAQVKEERDETGSADLKAEDGAAVAEADQAGAQVKEEGDATQPSMVTGSQPTSTSAEMGDLQQHSPRKSAAAAAPQKAAVTPKPPTGKKRSAKTSPGVGKPKKGRVADSGQGKLDSFFIKNSA